MEHWLSGENRILEASEGWAFLYHALKCHKDNTHKESSTRTARGDSCDAARRRAMPAAMIDTYGRLLAFRRTLMCPSECSDLTEQLTTSSTSSCSFSRWDWLLSKVPLTGVDGGWTCIATFTGILTIRCE